jgi:adenylosuccinate synthase
MQQALITVDLGFGDAGKGTVVDALVRHYNATLVVRYNGGAQAGHNVVTPEGLHHCFAQFGSGTLVEGTRTLLSRYMLVNPLLLQAEEQSLAQKGIFDAFQRTYIDQRALVTTPYHRALNRLREMSRGALRHGSCGKGVGETVSFAMQHPGEALFVQDIASPNLFNKLNRIRTRLSETATQLPFVSFPEEVQKEFSTFESDTIPEVVRRYADFYERVNIISSDEVKKLLSAEQTLIFEGAQGTLLDEDFGFHPFTTWSKTTTEFARRILNEIDYDGASSRIGITRTYATRHGPGPFVTETPELLKLFLDPYNATNPWQKHMRNGWLDLPLLRYAIAVNGGIDQLAVTHCDALELRPLWITAEDYYDTKTGDLFKLDPVFLGDLNARERLTDKMMSGLRYTENKVQAADMIPHIATSLNLPITIKSYGPRSHQKRILSTVTQPTKTGSLRAT